MAAAGYVSNVTMQVGAWYGVALEAAQVAQATAWQEAAEAVIDGATGRAWGGGTVTNERHTPEGPYLYLDRTPLANDTVTITSYQRGSTTGQALTLTSQYEVDDLARGRLYLAGWRAYCQSYLLISYTAAEPVPAAISEATAALLAEWLTHPTADAPAGAITRTRVGDVEVEYSDTAPLPVGTTLPARVRQLLAPYLNGLVFA